MRTLIIYAHPNDQSFCNAILATAVSACNKNGQNVRVSDLYQEHFNPVMTKEELRGIIDKKVIDKQTREYIDAIKASDHLILIFPVWWTTMPAMMKGFIDKVIFPSEIYDYNKNGHGVTGLLPNIKVTVISTMDCPSLIYKFFYGNVLKYALIKGIFKTIGVKKVNWLNFSVVKRSTRLQRKIWLAKVRKAMSQNE